jgi:hypothetical protein
MMDSYEHTTVAPEIRLFVDTQITEQLTWFQRRATRLGVGSAEDVFGSDQLPGELTKEQGAELSNIASEIGIGNVSTNYASLEKGSRLIIGNSVEDMLAAERVADMESPQIFDAVAANKAIASAKASRGRETDLEAQRRVFEEVVESLVPRAAPYYRQVMAGTPKARIAVYEEQAAREPGASGENLSKALGALNTLSQELNERSVTEVVYVGSPHQRLVEHDKEMIVNLLKTVPETDEEYRAGLTSLFQDDATMYAVASVLARHRATVKDEKELPYGYEGTPSGGSDLRYEKTGQLTELGSTPAGQRVRLLQADVQTTDPESTVGLTEFVAAVSRSEGRDEPIVAITEGSPLLTLDFMKASLSAGCKLGISRPGRSVHSEVTEVPLPYPTPRVPAEMASGYIRDYYRQLRAFAQSL